jgi:hypothetical protein
LADLIKLEKQMEEAERNMLRSMTREQRLWWEKNNAGKINR